MVTLTISSTEIFSIEIFSVDSSLFQYRSSAFRPPPAISSQSLKRTNVRSNGLLLAIQLNDQLLVDVLVDIFTTRLSRDTANQLLGVGDLEP